MLSSPRRPSSTMRIFSSAEWCRRVALRISRTVFSALSGTRLLACLIVAPQRDYDEPAILSYAISSFCPTSADGLQWRETCELNKDHPEASDIFNPGKLPALHDPFAGGGSIPLEAQRLGLEAYASDLNPVAA